MRTVVVGTAGHIDHGKSALVRALTGTDPDRLKEERERGITIDLGFAHLAGVDGPTLSFVDVPGHERFVRNMLAGAAGIDVVLLVVAADESVMPQTREHLDICRLLGVRAGVVALTKADLADSETRELCRLEIAEAVEGSFLEGAPVVEVSSVNGTGLERLVATLRDAAVSVPERSSEGPFRLPVDRVFSLRGFGTVVTGTAVSGTVSVGDELELLPSGCRGRVRGLQAHGAAAASGHAGQRLALNLGAVARDDLGRGEVAATPGAFQATSALDVEAALLPDAPELADNARVRLHLGTAEVMARLRWAGGEPPRPGGRRVAQLRTEAPVVGVAAERFVLRRYSPVVTVGGGRVLHPRPPDRLRPSDGRRAAALERLAEAAREGRAQLAEGLVELAGARGAAETDLSAWTGVLPSAWGDLLRPAVASGRLVRIAGASATWLASGELDRARERILVLLEGFHGTEPLQLGMPKQELAERSRLGATVFAAALRAAEAAGQVRVDRDLVAASAHEVRLTEAEAAARDLILSEHQRGGLRPPDLPEVLARTAIEPEKARRLVHLLLGSGALVRIKEGMLVASEAMAGLLGDMASWYRSGEVFSVPDFKERSGVSRKHAIPLLEHLDAQGRTRRLGDGRTWLGDDGRPERAEGSQE